MASVASIASRDDRAAGREEVHFRARGTAPDGRPIALLIVNISAMGLMARCDDALAEGDRVLITLPVVGTIAAEIRWSLGGRIGCELDRTIDLASYYGLLAVMLRGR